MRKRKKSYYKNKVNIVLYIALPMLIIFYSKSLIEKQSYELIINQTLPYYTTNSDNQSGIQQKLISPEEDEGENAQNVYASQVPAQTPAESESNTVVADKIEVNSKQQSNTQIELYGIDDVIYQPETDIDSAASSIKEHITSFDSEKLLDKNYIRNSFYIVDKKTYILDTQLDIENFLQADLTIDEQSEGPKILIFHTHSHEDYIGGQTVLDAGELLKNHLETKYNISVLHNTDKFDIVDSKTQIIGAYERMEPVIKGILKQYPSIEVIIDLHRDGVRDNVRLVTTIDGKETAQIMFFNGMSQIIENGERAKLTVLENPYIQTNLALSFNLQLHANEMFPHFTRKVYLNAYRYSLHMLPKSILVEVGAQTNTFAEVQNAMEPLADILASVLKK